MVSQTAIMAEKKTGRKNSFWGCRRGKENTGDLHEYNVQINKLPPVGAVVRVHELHIYERAKGTEQVLTAYKPSSVHRDVWGYPIAYHVSGYTLGVDNPLDPRNFVILEYKTSAGITLETRIKTLFIATGSMVLQEVDELEEMPLHLYNYENAISVDHGAYYNKKKRAGR